MDIELIKWMIRREYKTKFYLDKLPSGYNLYPIKDKNDNPEIHYTSGIPLGYFVSYFDGTETFYIYNHFTFNVKVHYEKNLDKYTVVGFDVIPISINHNIAGYMTNDGVITEKNSNNSVNKYESEIKDISTGEWVLGKNSATYISEAKHDTNKLRILNEDFLKSENNNTNTNTTTTHEKTNEENINNTEKKKGEAIELNEKIENASNPLINENPKSESEKLCKIFFRII